MNTKLRSVEVKNSTDGSMAIIAKFHGFFQATSVNMDDAVQHYPIAVIEYTDGSIDSVDATNITFINT